MPASDSFGKGGKKGKWFEAGKGAQQAMQTHLSDKKNELLNRKADELKEKLMKSSLVRTENSESRDMLKAKLNRQREDEDKKKESLNRPATEEKLKSGLVRPEKSESKTAGAIPRPQSGARVHGSGKQKPIRRRLTGKQRPPHGYPGDKARGPVEAPSPKSALVNAQPGDNPAQRKRPRWCWEEGHHFPVPSQEDPAVAPVEEPARTDVQKETDACNLVSRFDEEISQLLSRGEESGDIPADGCSGDQGGPLATEDAAMPQGPPQLLESIVKGAVFLSETKDSHHPGKMASLRATLKAVDQLADWHWPATAGLGLGLAEEEGFEEDFDKTAEDANAARKHRKVVAEPALLGSSSFSFEALARGLC